MSNSANPGSSVRERVLMAGSGSDDGEWGIYAFSGVYILAVGAVWSVNAMGHGLGMLGSVLATIAIVIMWFVTLRIDSYRRDRSHNSVVQANDQRLINKAWQSGQLAADLHVDYD